MDSPEDWELVEASINAVHLWPSQGVGLCGQRCGPQQEAKGVEKGWWSAITCRKCLTLASDPKYMDSRDGVRGEIIASLAKEQLKRLDELHT